jgi:hypothetical protein
MELGLWKRFCACKGGSFDCAKGLFANRIDRLDSALRQS